LETETAGNGFRSGLLLRDFWPIWVSSWKPFGTNWLPIDSIDPRRKPILGPDKRVETMPHNLIECTIVRSSRLAGLHLGGVRMEQLPLVSEGDDCRLVVELFPLERTLYGDALRPTPQ
jgi:hypothetical protein